MPVVFQDERHTSQEASGLLRPARLTRGRKKERHDAVAAQVILGTWLEKQTTSQKTLLTGEDKTLYNDTKNE